ncbi:MAG: methyltransferase domain-containing protein [Chloroflexi bacterium]|nr:methyltransferase domain-containing protein [Chloroflexota bacterium]
MQYLFSDTDVAARRLQVVTQVFAEATKPFLLEVGPRRPRLTYDLGCGPGFTTHLLADTLECERVVGLDTSPHFLTLARQRATSRTAFALHDVTALPFPEGPGDLIYCRFLLTHLPDPSAVLGRWTSQLRPQGRLLAEEVEWIHTTNEVFQTYLDIVEAMLAAQSTHLYVGPLLDRRGDIEGTRRQVSWVYRLSVPTHLAATVFRLNMQAWRDEPFVREHYSASALEELEQALVSLTQREAREPEIEWGVRQLAWARVF